MGPGNDLRRVVCAQKPNVVRILTRKCWATRVGDLTMAFALDDIERAVWASGALAYWVVRVLVQRKQGET